MTHSSSKAIIFLNGESTDFSSVVKHIDKNALLIGCDGGTKHIFSLGHTPHVVIGDFDSLPYPSASCIKRQQNSTTFIRYPIDKDYTDSELAINYAVQQGYHEVILAGAYGSRLDHVLANIFLLLKRKFRTLNITIIAKNQQIYLIRKERTIKGRIGDTISFIPIRGTAQVLSSNGLQYDLSKYKLSLQGNQGISNVLISETANIKMKKNVLLAIHQNA